MNQTRQDPSEEIDSMHLCALTDIVEHACWEFTLDRAASGHDGFLVNGGNGVYAYRNSCPHTGATLNWQSNLFLDPDGRYILCSLHGALFQIHTGLCVFGPCKGSRLERIAIEVRGGRVYLKGATAE